MFRNKAKRGRFMIVPISAKSHDQIYHLPLDLIRRNPHQPRTIFDEKTLYELSESIKVYGVIQPITVRATHGHSYELVAGERRLRAANLAGLSKIPAIISDMSDKSSAVIALIENLQREDLNFVEEAHSFKKLMSEFGFTQEVLAARIGKSQSSVANKIRILKLSEPVLSTLVENNLSERHGRALLALPDEELRLKALSKITKEQLTVKKTEELVEKLLNQKPEKNILKKNLRFKLKDVKIFINTLKQSIAFMEKAGFQADFEMLDNGSEYEFKICLKPGEE